jgi:hypothetical protein
LLSVDIPAELVGRGEQRHLPCVSAGADPALPGREGDLIPLGAGAAVGTHEQPLPGHDHAKLAWLAVTGRLVACVKSERALAGEEGKLARTP